MRIISGFKDYYDSVQRYGSDPNIVYVRLEESVNGVSPVSYWWQNRTAFWDERANWIPQDLRPFLLGPITALLGLPYSVVRLKGRTYTNFDLTFDTRIVGFCGRLYPAMTVDHRTYYSIDKMLKGISEEYLRRFGLDKKRMADAVSWKKPHYYIYGGYRGHPLTHETWNKSVEDLTVRRYDDVFIRLGVPVFRLDFLRSENGTRIRLTRNPRLKDDDFQRVRSPSDAYQELAMYVGNELARQPDPVSAIPDHIMRDEKGFDEWSFRRHKADDKKLKRHR